LGVVAKVLQQTTYRWFQGTTTQERENPYWNILHAMNLNDARLKSFFSVPTIV